MSLSLSKGEFRVLVSILNVFRSLSKRSWLFDFKCTSATFHSNRPIRGTSLVRGKFPFVIALLQASDSKMFCGGSLITNKHVLAAAHCVHKKKSSSMMDPYDILVLLGRFNLNLPTERKSEHRDVDKIVIHEDWKIYSEKFDGDLAILVMDYSVQFSEFIRAVCLENDQNHTGFNNGISVS